MATFKCKMCGGTLEIESGSTVAECEYCGAKQTLPRLDDEKRSNLLERANQLRRNNDFDKASSIYEQILSEDNSDSEIYWSIVLCQYGIDYVEDPLSKKRVPTVNRTQYTSIFDNENYKEAILKADSYQRLIYEEEAKQINEIQKGILEISQKEEPFDVFICYKETDANGQRTIDSVLANDLYYQLKQENFKVFYAKITLEDKLGSAYEPYIFAALNSSKVMVVIGTKPEYFEAPWVKNEWSRFLAQIKKGEKKMLIPAYRDMDPYNLPIEFSHLQAQDMSKLGFMQDLIRGIKKILGKDNKKVEVVEKVIQNTDSTAPLLRRAHLFLEDKDFVSADEYAEKVLDINPECSQAYFIKFLAEYKLSSVKDLEKSSNENIFNSANYNKAYRFANEKEKENLDKISKQVYNNFGELKKAKIYKTANEWLAMGDFASAIEEFNKIIDYKDSKEKIELAKEKSETNRKQRIYNTAVGHINMSRFEDAKKLFKSIEDFKDAKEKIEYCDSQIEIFEKNDKYYKAIGIINNYQSSISQLKNALELLNSIIGYKDVDSRIRSLNAKIEDLEAKQKIKEQQEKERLEAERRTKERNEQIKKQIKERLKRNAKKIVGLASAAVVFITTLVILINSLIIPTIKFNKATDFLNQGMYNEALDLYEQIGDFKEANSYYNVADAVKSFGNKRLYAGLDSLYEAKVPVKINYNMNDGYFSNETLSDPNIKGKKQSQGNSDVVSFEYNAGEDFRELKIPSRIGYTFYDWSFSKYSYQVGEQFVLDIEAVWNEIQYSVSYELNGGLFWDQSPINNYYVTSNTFNLCEPVKRGYDFVGWIGTDLTSPTKTVTISQGSIGNRNYEAVWEAKDYVITYNPNGGSVSSTTQTVTFNEQYNLLTPTRLGYVFLGWYEANNRQFYSGIYNVDYNVELTAKWELGSYKLTLDDTRKSSDSVTVYFMNNYNGGIHETVTLKNNQILSYPVNPTRSGYVFNGWHTDSSANNDYNFTGSITSDLYLYAGWTPSNYNVLTSDTMSVTLNGTSNIYYGFIPLVSETITVYSTGNYDTRGYLYSSTLSQLKYDDDSGNGSNFSYTYSVTAGNLYYIAINSYSNSTYGSVTLNVTRTNTIYSSAYVSIEENNFYYDTSSSYVSALSHNTSFTLPELELTGYTFEGWYDEDDNKVVSGVFAFGKDVTLTPKFTANEYTITYEANEGTISSTTQDVIFDEPHILLEPTRTGYTFLGWYDEDDNKVENGTWTFDHDVTLKAKWEAIIYYINYDANGGVVDSSSKTITYGELYLLLEPTRVGYTFKGWYTEDDDKFSDGIWELTSDIDLKAKWEANKYVISLDANGGEAEDESLDIIYDQTYELPVPTRVGYNFVKWEDEEENEFANNGTWNVAKDVSLKAIWTQEGFVITYDPNGGSLSTLTQVVKYDDYYYLANPTRTGYSFEGWYTEDDVKFNNGTWKLLENINLKAKWEIIDYTITLNPNGGSISDTSIVVNYNDDVKLETPERTGYTFIGWYRNGSLVELDKFTYTSNITLTAKWDANTYEITYNETNCTESEVSVYDKDSKYILKVDYDSEYKLILPTRTGYSFLGWYIEEDVKFEEGKWNLLTDISLTSKWEKNKYTLTYDPNGGEVNELTQEYYFDEEYELLAPTRTGYNFVGWYLDNELFEDGIWNQDSNITIKAKWEARDDITYTINHYKQNLEDDDYTLDCSVELKGVADSTVWAERKTYEGFTSPVTVSIKISPDGTSYKDYYYTRNSYTINFASNSDVEVEDISGKYGYQYELPKGSKEGFEFDGWYIDALLTQPFEEESVISKNITLYAKYKGETTPDKFNYDEIGTSIYITKYIGEDNEVVVPSHIGGKKVFMVEGTTFINNTNITKVSIYYDETLLESGLFGGCTSLEEITFGHDIRFSFLFGIVEIENTTKIGLYYVPNGIKKVIYTGEELYSSAFEDCTMIEEIILTKTTNIPQFAFYNCTSLKRINSDVDGVFILPDTVNSISNKAFYNCTLLEELILNEGIETIEANAFNGTTQIKRINSDEDFVFVLPDGLKTIEANAFDGLTQVKEIVVPESVETIGTGAFKGLNALEKITIPFVGGSEETTGYQAVFGYIFGYTYSSSSVNIKNNQYLTSNTSYTYTSQYPSATSNSYTTNYYYYIPKSIRDVTITVQKNIPECAFQNCDLIENISLPMNTETIGQYAFYNCNLLETLNSEEQYKIEIPDTCTSIGSYAFTNAALIEEVYVPESVETIGVGAFKGLNALEKITIPFVGNSEKATVYQAVFGYIFGYTYSTNYVDKNQYLTSNTSYTYTSQYPNASTTSSTTNYYYYIPESIRDVTITVQKNIPSCAFQNCDLIENISLPIDTESIGQYAFYNCTNLTRLNSEVDGEINIPESITDISNYAFYGCSLVDKVTFGDVERIGSRAFYNCNLLETVNSEEQYKIEIPDTCTSIGSYAFTNAALIEEVYVPESVEIIGTGAFKGLNALEKITIPFVGNSEKATGYQAVFGYIFGYSSSSELVKNYQYTTSNKSYTYTTQYPSATTNSYATNYYYYIPESIRDVTITVQKNIPECAFQNCDLISNITLPIGAKLDNSYSFYKCVATINTTHNPKVSGVWDGTVATSYQSGTGTQEDPYIIFTAEQFAYFLEQGDSVSPNYYKLTSNIRLGGKTITGIDYFYGVLDGNGYVVKDFVISGTGSVGVIEHLLNNAVLKNIGFENITITNTSTESGNYYTGVVGNAWSGSVISNVYSTGTIITTAAYYAYAGGLVGYSSGTIENSYSTCTVSATSSSLIATAGGLVGYLSGTIENSFATGNVTAKGANNTYSENGPVYGDKISDASITNCYATDTQVLTRYTSAGYYNNDGTITTLKDIKNSLKELWEVNWNMDKRLPILKKDK